MKVWIVRALAGGCVIGGCLEDLHGKPLTARTAENLAAFENERTRKRRAQRLCGFDYVADSFEKGQP